MEGHLRNHGVDISRDFYVSCYLAPLDFVPDIETHFRVAVQAIAPIVGTVVGAWLGARSCRRVRLKVGDIEAEAHTAEEVEKLLLRAQEIKQDNVPKLIHER